MIIVVMIDHGIATMIDHGRRSSPSAPGQALARDYGAFSSPAKVRLVCLLRVANGPRGSLQMFLFLNGFLGGSLGV